MAVHDRRERKMPNSNSSSSGEKEMVVNISDNDQVGLTSNHNICLLLNFKLLNNYDHLCGQGEAEMLDTSSSDEVTIPNSFSFTPFRSCLKDHAMVV